MKKLLLGLGTIAAVVAPVSAVIACDMGTLTLTWNSNSTLSEGDFKDKVDTYKTKLPTTYNQIESDLGLDSGVFASATSDPGTTLTFTSITYDNKVLKVNGNTFKPKGPGNDEDTTMEFNQEIFIDNFK